MNIVLSFDGWSDYENADYVKELNVGKFLSKIRCFKIKA